MLVRVRLWVVNWPTVQPVADGAQEVIAKQVVVVMVVLIVCWVLLEKSAVARGSFVGFKVAGGLRIAEDVEEHDAFGAGLESQGNWA